MAATPDNRFIRIKNKEHFTQVFNLFINNGQEFNRNLGFGGIQCKKRDIADELLEELERTGNTDSEKHWEIIVKLFSKHPINIMWNKRWPSFRIVGDEFITNQLWWGKWSEHYRVEYILGKSGTKKLAITK